jgi:hypothetical protein
MSSPAHCKASSWPEQPTVRPAIQKTRPWPLQHIWSPVNGPPSLWQTSHGKTRPLSVQCIGSPAQPIPCPEPGYTSQWSAHSVGSPAHIQHTQGQPSPWQVHPMDSPAHGKSVPSSCRPMTSPGDASLHQDQPGSTPSHPITSRIWQAQHIGSTDQPIFRKAKAQPGPSPAQRRSRNRRLETA